MKATIEAKRYDSEKCETLGSIDHYSNGNLSGETYLLLATDGKYLVLNTSNGQDCYRASGLDEWLPDELPIDAFDLSDDEELRCVALNLIEIV